MHTVFIVNNLKVSPFLPYDSCVRGCELLTYDTESYTKGTLWDIGFDSAYYVGENRVRGQLWKLTSDKALEDLSELLGAKSGLTKKCFTPVTIEVDKEVITTIDSIVFRLTSIKEQYKLVHDEVWTVKRL